MRSTAASLLFISRLCTKSGDNAWSFALPLALVHIYPDTLRPVSLFYLLSRIGVMLLMPSAGGWLDRLSRPSAVKRTVLAQLPLTAALTLVIGTLASFNTAAGEAVRNGTSPFSTTAGLIAFAALIGLTTLSQVSSHLSSVLLTADFIPCLFREEGLTGANTTLRRIDLLTESLSPVVAGFLLASVAWEPFALSGFVIIAVWNFLSFFIELLVLHHFLKTGMLPKNRNASESAPSSGTTGLSRWKRLKAELSLFHGQTAFLTMLGLSFMHITVLSAPSIVGTTFLKAGWDLSEDVIGLFRGTGAVISIIATMFTAKLIRECGLPKAAAFFSSLQTLFVLFAACAFHWGRDAAFIYLALIVLSRFGHSGFILCEMQIRQETVPRAELGLINGIAVSINSIGSFVILLLGAAFSDPADFAILVWCSAAAIAMCTVLSTIWAFRGKGRLLSGPHLRRAQPAGIAPESTVPTEQTALGQ